MIETTISVTMNTPPIAAAREIVALAMCGLRLGSTSGCRNHAAAAADAQPRMARTSRVKPRTAASRAEIRTTPITARSRIEMGMRERPRVRGTPADRRRRLRGVCRDPCASPRPCGDIAAGGRRSPLQAGRGEAQEGPRPMRERRARRRPVDAVLLLGRHLAEGPVEAVRPEHRVVAEALRAARRPDQRRRRRGPRTAPSWPSGQATTSAETKCARRSAARSRRVEQFALDPRHRGAEILARARPSGPRTGPGAPSSASTQRPESSAKAGRPRLARAAHAP